MKFELNLGPSKTQIDTSPVEKYLRALPKLIGAFIGCLTSSEVPLSMKLYAISGITYFLSPLDIVPDLFTGVGFVDDTIFVLLIMQVFLSKVDKPVLQRLLKTDQAEVDEIFFDVKEGVETLSKFFTGIYKTVRDSFDLLVKVYSTKTTAKKDEVVSEPVSKSIPDTLAKEVS